MQNENYYDRKFDNFRRDLDVEIIKGEVIRAKLLSAIFLFNTTIFCIFPLFFRENYFRAFSENINPFIPPIFFFSVSLYFFVNSKLIKRLLNRNKPLPTFPRYLNAFVETSLPSFAILYLGTIREPAIYILLTPPVFIYFMFIIISALQLNFKLCVFTGFVAAIEYLGLAFYFSYKSEGMTTVYFITTIASHVVKSCIYLFAGVIIGFITSQIEKRIVNSFILTEERNRVTSIFGQHVSPAVVDKLLSQSEFISETKLVCIMFFDIRNFTNFSENRNPEEVVSYLNAIFDFSIDIINQNDGIINKFLGDGFMAVFGAPISGGQDIHNAVKASLEIINRIEKEVELKSIPKTKIGIGLHSGEAVTGNVGSSLRKEYTIIGDVVNLASRIEQLNKTYSSQLLVSEDVWTYLKGFQGEALGEVLVKGREKPIRIYKLA